MKYQWIIILSLCLDLITCVTCINWQMTIFRFVEQSDPTLNALSCARASNRLRTCGCRRSISDNTYMGLDQSGWCNDRTTEAGYEITETNMFTIVGPMEYFENNNYWYLYGFPRMCMTPRSVVETTVTLRTGWTIACFQIKTFPGDFPLKIKIQQGVIGMELTSYRKCDSEVENCPTQLLVVNSVHVDGLNFRTDLTYMISIERDTSTYKVFLNRKLYYEFNPGLNNITPKQASMIFYGSVRSDVHYIQFRHAL